jgi:serine/threonine protein kinase
MELERYELGRELGRGGVGIVVRGRSPDGKDVAIKFLKKSGDEVLARFEREGRMLDTLGEEAGFVPLLDSGTSPRGPFLVMPFVPGGTLRDRLEERGAFSIDETIALGRALGETLGRAHALGIIHRDLKPENVLFTALGQPLVADLGLAKHYRHDAPGAPRSVQISKTGTVRGTWGYMPSEQGRDAKAVKPTSDVFALGAILYECLSGRAAFPGETVMEVVTKVELDEFEPLASLRPDAPAWLVGIIEKAMSKAPEERFADGAALAKALAEGPSSGVAPRVRAARVPAPQKARGRERIAIVAGAIVILFIAAAWAVLHLISAS